MRAPGHVLTYVLSDVEGSTELWDRAPDAMRAALDRHDQIITQIAGRHTGRVISERGEGDSSFTVFARAADAIAYAIELQHTLTAEVWPTPTPLRIRIGVHTGHPAEAYLEPGANACARVRDLAAGGQVLVSGSTASRVADVLPAHASLRDLGRHRLRGLVTPEQILQLVDPSIPDGFPPLRSLSSIPNNLPVPLTSFIGRAREIDQVRASLRDNRLVTIVGTGGAGKTRLAIEAAEASLGDFADGVWLIELLNALAGESIDHLAAAAVGVQAAQARDALAAAADRIGQRHTLLLFDNCEHVVEHAARAVTTLLQSCPNLRVLATSREVLRTPGEAVVELAPLPAPPDGVSAETAATYDSVRLFVERARLQRPDLRLDEATARHVSSICRRLDGLPLAVELAAARTRMLSVHDIDERLDDFEGGGLRGMAEHHQTIEASIAWSVDQLSDAERRLFQRLSVFAGGWTLEQAESVCGYEPFACETVAMVLGSLVDRSLVTVQQHGEESRFRMLETVRAFGARALDEHDARVARARHLDYFNHLAMRARDALEGPRQAMWLDRLARSDADLIAALQVAIETDPSQGLLLATRLASYWERRGHVRDGVRWLTRAIEAAGDVSTERLAAAHLEAGHLAMEAGESALAHAHLARAQQIARACGADKTLTGALAEIAALHHLEGDNDSARRTYDELLEIAHARQDPQLEARVLGNLGNVAHSQRDLGTATALYERALEAERAIGNARGIAGNLRNLSGVALALYDYPAAQRYAQEGLEIAIILQDPSLKGMLLTQLGNALLEMDDVEGARARYGEALTEHLSAQDGPGVAVATFCLAELNLLAGNHDDALAQATGALAAFRSFRAPRGEAAALRVLGEIETALGRYQEATSRFKDSIALASSLGDRLLVAGVAQGLASVCAATEAWERAAECIGIATEIRRSLGVPVLPSRAFMWDGLVTSARKILGDAAFDSAVERARSADMNAVLAFASDG